MKISDLRTPVSEAEQRLDELLKFFGPKVQGRAESLVYKKQYKAALAELKRRWDSGDRRNVVAKVALEYGLDSPRAFALVATKAGVIPEPDQKMAA